MKVQASLEQENETLRDRISQMKTIEKLNDQLIKNLSERDLIRKKYLEMHIKEAGNGLKKLEAEIGYNPFRGRPNDFQLQQVSTLAKQHLSSLVASESTDTTNREEEKEERKANEGPFTCTPGFNVNSKPFISKPMNGQAQQSLLPIDEGFIDCKKKRNPKLEELRIHDIN